MALSDILRDKIRLLESARERLSDSVRQTEEEIFDSLMTQLISLGVTEGNFEPTEDNLALLDEISDTLLQTITSSDLAQNVTQTVLNDTAEVEDLVFQAYDEDNNDIAAAPLRELLDNTVDVDEARFIRKVIDGVTNEAVISQNLLLPIREQLFDSIVNGESVTEVRRKLRTLIVSEEGVNSNLLSYVSQLSRDALSQYEGARQDRIRKEFSLDGLIYLGTQIETTRPWCCAMLHARSIPLKSASARRKCDEIERALEDYHLGDGRYRVSDIQVFIDLGVGTSGFNENVTVDTFAQYRGGYACRHSIMYIKL